MSIVLTIYSIMTTNNTQQTSLTNSMDATQFMYDNTEISNCYDKFHAINSNMINTSLVLQATKYNDVYYIQYINIKPCSGYWEKMN